MNIDFGKDKKFSIDFEDLLDFCGAVDRFPTKSVINFMSDGSIFRIYSLSDGFCAIYDHPVQLDWYVSCAVEAQRFASFVKKLYPGKVDFKITDKKLKVKKDNIKAEFALRDAVPYGSPGQFYELYDLSLLQPLETSSKTGIKEERFPGIVVDSTNPTNCKVCKFSSHVIKVSSVGKVFDSPCCFTVNDNFARILPFFSGKVEKILLSENIFGISLKSGIITYSTLADNKFSTNFMDMFGLSDSACLIHPQNYNFYKFDKKEFLSVLDLVSSVLGEEESSVRYDTVGRDKDGKLVWKVSGTTFNGSTVEELLSCESSVDEQMSFCVNKKNLMKMVSLYGEELAVYLNSKDPMLLSNMNGSDITLLVQMRM